MPEYGKTEYWNERYKQTSSDSPFDWLFGFDDVQVVLNELIPNDHKNDRVLLVGAGNAPFSPDLYFKGGYTNLCNIDLSDVVIKQQQNSYPEQEWLVMDVRDMSYFANETFPIVIDKSLIDTLACYQTR